MTVLATLHRIAHTWRWVHLTLFAAFLISWTVVLLLPVPQEEAERVFRNKDNVFYFGKLLHLSAYAWLMLLGGSFILLRKYRLLLAVGLSAHGGLTEYIQQFTGRSASVRDWALDTVGVLVGVGLVWLWWREKTNAPSYQAKTEVNAKV